MMFWQWRTLKIRYQQSGTHGPAVICIHGFGASSDHWRKNLPDWGKSLRVYAIDLVGFGLSDKPTQGLDYTFETWAAQIIDFAQQVIQEPVFLVGNSIGCVAAMQAAVTAPDWVKGVVLLNCSLRLLHDRLRAKLPWYRRYSTGLIQNLLSWQPLGYFFFRRLANHRVVKKILLQAYADPTAVTDELVELILKPAYSEGAADVFLAFIRYSQGPLPADLLPQLTCPGLILWGEADPWEPLALGRELAKFPAIEEFISLPGVGHCPQDESPELVNPIIQKWIIDKGYAT